MKVIIFGNQSLKTHKRGIENVILSQLDIYKNFIVYYIHWGGGDSIYLYNGVICISINNKSFWPFRLNLILNSIGSDSFIHSHNPLFSLFSLKKTDIITVHDGLYYMAKSAKRKVAFLFYFFEKILYSRVGKIHFISNFTKDQSLLNINRDFKIIYNSSHLEGIKYLNSITSSYTNYILIVKNIEERARFDLIVQVAIEMPDKLFLIAGRGPLFQFYSEIIQLKKVGNIKMLGFVEDDFLIELYKNSSFVINLAEFGEGFGLPIIEAYLFNKPVIASRICAIPEIIIDDNHLVNNNVTDIIEKIVIVSKESSIATEKYQKYYFSNFSKSVITLRTKEFVQSSFNR